MKNNNLDFKVCSFDGCENVARVRGLCPTHYDQERLGRSSRSADTSPYPICAVEHCERVARSRADGTLCNPHYRLKCLGVDISVPSSRGKGYGKKFMSDIGCYIDGCPRPAQTKRLCKHHYDYVRTGKISVPQELGVKLNPPCTAPGCERISMTIKSGLCRTHFVHKNAGKEPGKIRDWGKYTKPEYCAVETCRKPATSTPGVCGVHRGMLTTYKITVEELISLMSIDQCQNPGCTNTVRLHIDHDHEAGVVRGMLCSGCNVALGHLGESEDRILGLIEYTRNPPGIPTA